MKTASAPTSNKAPDYPELRKQINDFESTFYGPHSCGSCGVQVVKMAIEQGGHSFTVPRGEEAKYKPHFCRGTEDPLMGYSHFDFNQLQRPTPCRKDSHNRGCVGS